MANGLQGRGRIRTISILPTGPGDRKNFSRLILKQTNGHFDPWRSKVFKGRFGQETYRSATRDRAVSWSMAYRPLGISGDLGGEIEAKRCQQSASDAPCRSGPCPRSVGRAGGRSVSIIWGVLPWRGCSSAALAYARASGFAPSGDLLWRTTHSRQRSHPWHPAFRFAKSTLGFSEFQGHALTGHPWPIAALATSMSLNP
jgi:hypothetical protein